VNIRLEVTTIRPLGRYFLMEYAMPRNVSGVYSLPPNTPGVPGEVIESARYNAFLADLTADLNAARPIVAGGTGGTNAPDARENLGIVTGKQ